MSLIVTLLRRITWLNGQYYFNYALPDAQPDAQSTQWGLQGKTILGLPDTGRQVI